MPRPTTPRSFACALLLLLPSCGDSSPPTPENEDDDTNAVETESPSSTTGTPTPTSTTGDPPDPDTSTTEDPDPTVADTTETDGECTPVVVLMGYWPPTNEMLRPWSTNPEQNPGTWIGEDWGGYGYDLYSFFPEFPPDGDPSNDDIGDPGAVGDPAFDLRVDYQATSADFWRIVDEYQPVIVMTTSRGGETGWEIEAIEGGHGSGNPGDPAFDWSSDQHGDVQYPTMRTIEARSWDAITTYRQDLTLPSQLPLQEILDATEPLGLTSVAIDQTGTSGNFLSGFLGLHGLYYQSITPHAVAAGHIHVGFGLPTDTASQLIEASLHEVLQAHPVATVQCPG